MKLITREQLAKMLEVTPQTLVNWENGGQLPKPIRVCGSVRWDLAVIEKWIKEKCPSNS